MKTKTMPLPPRMPDAALRIIMRDGAAYFDFGDLFPDKPAPELVEWAKDLVEAWESQQHICYNCRKGTNYGSDGVYCNLPKYKDNPWMSPEPHWDGTRDFGEDCPDFEPYPDPVDDKTNNTDGEAVEQ